LWSFAAGSTTCDWPIYSGDPPKQEGIRYER
jgi:hypothetical protein